MRKVLTSIALGCAFALTLSAASACEYHDKQATAAADTAQTAQSQAAAAQD